MIPLSPGVLLGRATSSGLKVYTLVPASTWVTMREFPSLSLMVLTKSASPRLWATRRYTPGLSVALTPLSTLISGFLVSGRSAVSAAFWAISAQPSLVIFCEISRSKGSARVKPYSVPSILQSATLYRSITISASDRSLAMSSLPWALLSQGLTFRMQSRLRSRVSSAAAAHIWPANPMASSTAINTAVQRLVFMATPP